MSFLRLLSLLSFWFIACFFFGFVHGTSSAETKYQPEQKTSAAAFKQMRPSSVARFINDSMQKLQTDETLTKTLLENIDLSVLHPAFGVDWTKLIGENPQKWIIIMKRITASPQPPPEIRKRFGMSHGLPILERILEDGESRKFLFNIEPNLEWWARLPISYLEGRNGALLGYLTMQGNAHIDGILDRHYARNTPNKDKTKKLPQSPLLPTAT